MDNEKSMKDSRCGRSEYWRGQRLGRRINRMLDKCSVYLTPDMIDALRLAIASELLKLEARIEQMSGEKQ